MNLYKVKIETEIMVVANNDNLAILQGYTNNKNHKNILSEQLPQHQKFIKEYIQFHTNLATRNPWGTGIPTKSYEFDYEKV